MELLSAKHPGIPPTLRDDRLSEEVIHKCFSESEDSNKEVIDFGNKPVVSVSFILFSPSVSLQAEQLRQHYMTKYDSEVADAHQALQPVLQNIKELKRKVRAALCH